jgi:amino acid adenylation domain-containing protein/non-ribosomal peptide synthase protein (TIGR01720 family)
MSDRAQVANLSAAQKRQLLAQLLQQQAQTFPLSFAQQRLWFLDQLQPGLAAYNIPAAFHLTGDLNLSVLAASLQQIVQRHEVLRSRIVVKNGDPQQQVHPTLTVSLSIVDLRHLTPDPQQRAVRSALTAIAAQPFDLTQAPLFRAAVLQLRDREFVWLFTAHHIIADYDSMRLLVRELVGCYQAAIADRAPELPALPIQYADYAAWQRQWLASETAAQQLQYWQQQLADCPPLLPLPTDFPRPAVQSFRGARQAVALSPELSQAIVRFSQQQGVTLFMTIVTALKILLYRYTGQSDLVVGSTVTNRHRPELADLLGLFVNNLVFRTQFAPTLSGREVLQRVRDVTLNAYANQDFPFESLVEHLRPDRTLSYNPLFQVMVVLHQSTASSIALPGITLTPLTPDFTSTRFDLSLDLIETDTGLTGFIEYNTDLFTAATIARLTGHLQMLLSGLVAHPDQPIATLPLLTAAELQQQQDWNRTEQDFPPHCVHARFELQAAQTPDRVAAVDADQHITYQALNQRANQLAWYLRSQGVQPETRIGVYLDRSIHLLIALLGILKAGGTYIPLDPAFPRDRLNAMIADAQPSGILHHSATLPLQQSPETWQLHLTDDWSAIAAFPITNPPPATTPDHLAYIIYTSGSTGTPKGVQILHSALSNFLHAMQQAPGIQPSDVCLSITTLSFDIAALELYLPLITGARLILLPRAVTIDAPQLAAQLQQQQVTLMQATPATWRLLVASGWAGKPDLTLLCGGEALDRPLAQALRSRCCALWNLYGPTETTIWSAVHAVEHIPDTPTLPIGLPIANTHFHLLDSHFQPLPVGIPGQLHIGGAGLARGYLNRPALTAEKFLPHPPTPHSPTLYQTGDRARRLPDGTIEFLGRLDNQIKLRGFRIELGEIEAALLQHPQVSAAAVILEQSPDPRLIAYLVTEPPQPPQVWREFLACRLPSYMLPALYICLDHLPLTPNGKLDRRSLPAPEAPMPTAAIAWENPIEALLANLWAELLAVPTLSREDNFFDLGGHSLLATRLVAQVRQQLGIELPLRQIFDTPKLTDLAAAIAVAQTGLTLPPVVPLPRTDTLPLSFAQQRQWFLAQLEPESPFYLIPAAVEIHGSLDLTRLDQSVNALIQRHEVFRTAFETIAGQPVAHLRSIADFPVRLIDLSATIEPSATELPATVQTLIEQELQRPMALDRPPLLRVTVIKLTAARHLLLLVLHHVIADGWSMNLLVRELVQGYQSLTPLPPLPLQYADYAAWQQQWLQGSVLDSQLTYWRQQLTGAPALLELPTDRPRPAIQTTHGDSEPLHLSVSLTQSLQQLSQQVGCTLFMTLLAAFQVLLSRYSQSEDIVVGTPIANRRQSELEGMIGCFANTLALRTDLSGNPDFLTLLQRVKTVALGAYSHQDLPFEQLVEALQPVRSLSHTPLFQVMFLLQNATLQPLTIADLQWTPLSRRSTVAKFDLTLALSETPNGLVGQVEYNRDLFDRSTIQRLIGHLETLLSAIVAQPQQPIATLPLLTPAEQQQLAAWNPPSQPGRPGLIHTLVAAQVTRSPDAIALIDGDRQFSYCALNQRANQLAHYLQQRGIQPGQRIGICVNRSAELVVSLLGSLKAGAAYVPLDPTYPRDRLTWMVQDAQVAAVISDSLTLTGEFETILWQHDRAHIAACPATDPAPSLTPDHTAYVIYTSGSTGQPKGVAIAHRNTTALLDWAQQTYPLAQRQILAATSICFDLSVFEIFVPLCWGGSVILCENALALPELPDRNLVTLINTVPSAIAQLSRLSAIPASVQVINLAGEALSPSLVQQLQQHPQIQQIYNLYGPSEDTTYSTCACVFDRTAPSLRLAPAPTPRITIGRPLPNTQAYILDRHLQPLPVGIPGELYLAGAGIAQGYLKRPQLTAEKFLPNPLSPFSPTLYKTGDRARYLPDGTIEFLGRLDNQIKLRGFRIELGEIETVLGQHPAVQQAVAQVWKSAVGEQLAAYVVLAAEASPAILRSYLQTQLPDYMVPAVIQVLPTLPLTPNGKIDRRALPEPEIPVTDRGRVARSVTEQQLAEIWQRLLQRDAVSVDTSFFELGGDSILAIQMIAQASQVGLQLTPKQVFQFQTIAELAAVAQPLQTLANQGIITGDVPLTPIQHWFFEQPLVDRHHWNQSVLLSLATRVPPAAVAICLMALLQHHDALRLQFRASASGWQSTIAPPPTVPPLLQIDLSGLAAARQSEAIPAIASDLQTSLDLATGLVRIALFELGDAQPQRLLFVVHHLAIDGVSWRILFTDLQQTLQQTLAGQPLSLPAKTTSWQSWSQAWLTQEFATSTSATYWHRDRLPAAGRLPIDHCNGDHIWATVATHPLHFTPAETQQLLQQVPAAYQTQINDVLVTALMLALHRWTGDSAWWIELEAHGRDLSPALDVSRTVGWFTALFPVGLELPPENASQHLGAALKTIKEQLRQVPDRGLSYGYWCYLAPPEQRPDPQDLPTADIRFNYFGQTDHLFAAADGLTLATESTGNARSRRNQRDVLLEINGLITQGALRLDWQYSRSHHQAASIATLAQHYQESLRSLIQHCCSADAGGYTPSDFPQMQLSQAELDDLLSDL